MARDLLERSALDARESCEIFVASRYAQVACGIATDGSGARTKVFFERAGNRWLKVMRWTEPEVSPADASADSK